MRYSDVGGKEKNKHASKRVPGSQGGANKEIVLGVKNREGELRMQVVQNMRGSTVKSVIGQNVAKGATIMTDEHGAFRGLAKE